MRERITPSLVISVIALVVALGGASYAAIKIPKNSVGTKQLKKKAVTSAKVKDKTLLRKDFKPGQLPGATWYKDRQPTVPLLDLTNEYVPVVTSQKLPAGSYLLNGRVNVYAGGSNASIICSMVNDAAQNFTVDANKGVAVALSSPVVLEQPGKVSIFCNKATGTPQVAQAHIIATRVTKVTGGGS